jgi:hypothetical protein
MWMIDDLPDGNSVGMKLSSVTDLADQYSMSNSIVFEIIPAGERASLATSAPAHACNVVRAGTRRMS